MENAKSLVPKIIKKKGGYQEQNQEVYAPSIKRYLETCGLNLREENKLP